MALTANSPLPGTPALSLSDIRPPNPPPAIALSGSPVPPQQRVFFYSSEEWETFIQEWATGLKDSYFQIKRLGGTGDRGVDVAGFKTPNGFEGSWDCFQGKHYAGPLTLSDVVPEMIKILTNVIAGNYILPDRHAFLAPQGYATSLNNLFSRPSKLQQIFLEKLSSGSKLRVGLTDETLAKVRDLAEQIDFTIFQSIEILDILAAHRKTPYYVVRFGGALAPRPVPAGPPDNLDDTEVRYVGQLIEVYSEKYPRETFTPSQLSRHPKVKRHFQRQRISFYNAEALRLYARDSVPEGTFEALQDDIHSGVVDISEAEHACGLDRLTAVLATSGQLDLSAHTLVSVSRLDDRKGICHQLANDDRLSWMGRSDEDSTERPS